MKLKGIFYSLSGLATIMLLLMGSTMPFSEGNGTIESRTAIPEILLCEGDELTLIATGENAIDFSWFRNDTVFLGGEDTLRVRESGFYQVLSINEENCASLMSDGVMVEVIPIPRLELTDPPVLCDGATMDLTPYVEGFDPTTLDYRVENPEGRILTMEELERVDISGTYTFWAKDKRAECWPAVPEMMEVVISKEKIYALFDYKVNHKEARAPEDAEILANTTIEFKDYSVGNVKQWIWDFGDGNTSRDQHPIHAFDKKGRYEVTLTALNIDGCPSQMSMLLEIQDSYRIMIPNAFTPTREDGKNATFYPKHRGISAIQLEIFNTWGNLLYSTTKLEDSGWDGTLNGVMSPNGNYVYKVRFETMDGRVIHRTGVFLLFR